MRKGHCQERAEIVHSVDGVVIREMVYAIGREDVPAEDSSQSFRLHFYRRMLRDGPELNSYDRATSVTEYKVLERW